MKATISKSATKREAVKQAVKQAVSTVVSLPYVASADVEESTDYDALLTSTAAVDSYSFVRRNEYKPLVANNVSFKKDEILSRYGRADTFGRAFAEKLATVGIDEETYKIIAEHYNVSQKRFMSYINYYRSQRFNIVLHNGKYISAVCV